MGIQQPPAPVAAFGAAGNIVAETNPAVVAAGATALVADAGHRHAIATPATPSTQASGDAASSGAGTGFATDTHKHGFPTLAAALAQQEFLGPKLSAIPAVAVANNVCVANQAYLIAMETVTATMTLAAIITAIGVQNGNVDVGIYSTTDDATFTRVASLGSTACPGAATRVAFTLAATLNVGTRYYFAIAFDNATAQVPKMAPPAAIAPAVIGYIKASSFPLPASLATVTAIAAGGAGSGNPALMLGQVAGGQAI